MSGLLYHYTSGASLKSIIESYSFWATDINFLNDSAEHKVGFRQCTEAIEAIIMDTHGKHRDTLIAFYGEVLKTVEPNTLGRDTYIVSFAKEKDSITHWFSYCEKNEGYCIGFDEAEFFKGITDEKILRNFVRDFRDVTYEDVEEYRLKLYSVLKSDLIIENLESAISFADKKTNALEEIMFQAQQTQIIEEIYKEIIYSAGSYKHQGFKHEVEKRLIFSSRRSRCDEGYSYPDSGVEFRERRGVIYPYVKIKFALSSIKEIVIGPSADFLIRKKGLEHFLNRHGVECKITESETPLRFM